MPKSEKSRPKNTDMKIKLKNGKEGRLNVSEEYKSESNRYCMWCSKKYKKGNPVFAVTSDFADLFGSAENFISAVSSEKNTFCSQVHARLYLNSLT
jgi:hypothetical protein